jgi:sRNA-binding carbon storage regulator CsrA
MLCLTRKEGESILIYPENIPENMTVAELFAGGPIEIIISKINYSQCKVLLSAPQD